MQSCGSVTIKLSSLNFLYISGDVQTHFHCFAGQTCSNSLPNCLSLTHLPWFLCTKAGWDLESRELSFCLLVTSEDRVKWANLHLLGISCDLNLIPLVISEAFSLCTHQSTASWQLPPHTHTHTHTHTHSMSATHIHMNTVSVPLPTHTSAHAHTHILWGDCN